MKKLFIALLFVSVAACGQRRNTVIDLSSRDFTIDHTDTIPLLFRFTEKDTIINDTMGAIKYLIKENQRLYDLLEKKNQMFLDLSTIVSGLMLYIPKREQFFNL